MLIPSSFGARFVILFFLINLSASASQCDWKLEIDCWLLCTGGNSADVSQSAEEKWAERPQCHPNGIALGLFGIIYTNSSVRANWFQAKIKVNYLEFGTGFVNEMEDDAFNADAFKSVRHLSITKMDLYELKKGLFNGLESLEILNLRNASLIRSVDVGILDGLNRTLKELTIEMDRPMLLALNIESFTGSQQTLSLETVTIHYYLHRLTSESFLSLTNVKRLDVSHCGIIHIEEGSFDSVVTTVKELRLTNNGLITLPTGMFDLQPLRYDTYIYMGTDNGCACNHFAKNFIVKVDCDLGIDEADKLCRSFLPSELQTTESITTNTPSTIVLTSSTNEDTSAQPTPTPDESTTSEVPSTYLQRWVEKISLTMAVLMATVVFTLVIIVCFIFVQKLNYLFTSSQQSAVNRRELKKVYF